MMTWQKGIDRMSGSEAGGPLAGNGAVGWARRRMARRRCLLWLAAVRFRCLSMNKLAASDVLETARVGRVRAWEARVGRAFEAKCLV